MDEDDFFICTVAAIAVVMVVVFPAVKFKKVTKACKQLYGNEWQATRDRDGCINKLGEIRKI